MLCPVCHGRHFILMRGQQQPCPECHGIGELHCCDGLAEQPDASEAASPASCESEDDDYDAAR